MFDFFNFFILTIKYIPGITIVKYGNKISRYFYLAALKQVRLFFIRRNKDAECGSGTGR